MNLKNIHILEVEAGVRYWEDATVNGVEDESGTLIPFRKGELWCLRINIELGTVIDWPRGTTADIHYKVCDSGKYWLCDESGTKLEWSGDYVPNDFLCPEEECYGDYIILKIDDCGKISGWKKPEICSRWKEINVKL